MNLTVSGRMNRRPGNLPTSSEPHRRSARDDWSEGSLEIKLTNDSSNFRSRALTSCMEIDATRSRRQLLATNLNGHVKFGECYGSMIVRTFGSGSLLEGGVDRTLTWK